MGEARKTSLPPRLSVRFDFAGRGVDTAEGLLVAVEDVELVLIEERHADVAGEFLVGPGDVGLRDVAGPVGLDGEDGSALRRAGDDQAAGFDDGRHDPPMLLLLRVPSAAAPDSSPVAGSWPVTQSPPIARTSFLPPISIGIGVPYDSFDSATASFGRSCFQMSLPVAGSIASRYEGAGAALAAIATSAADRHVAMQDLNVKLAVVERGAGAVDPLVVELAVILGDVPRPLLVALEVKRDEVAGAVVEPNRLAVGQRRRRGEVVPLVLLEAFADLLASRGSCRRPC